MENNNTTDALGELLEESIRLEMNVSQLYSIYSRVFAEDKDFWWSLSLEEKNHAALLKSGRLYIKVGRLPVDAVYEKIESLRNVNAVLKKRIGEFSASPPAMQEAYHYAHGLENSAAELHYEYLMSLKADDRVIRIFQELGGGDRYHAERIAALMRTKKGPPGQK